ncbi:Hpt domain-containing protein [Thalassomonas sp. RHCl1]|uniref:Hpt domain-containing protein n=1 Tax=Thalassomonas sp. RHCl1 TaxID=2995320 RepID=UPI00248B3FAD|nr:Hpt domain-containing protein [Thalassomonas sp. RHCl1]
MLDVKQLDEELLNGYLEQLDKSIIAKMLDLYLQQSRLYLEEISAAVEADSQEQWQDRCHKMKGAAGSIGLKQLHAKLVMAEKFSEAQSQKRQLLAEILELNDTAIAAFKGWLEQL